MPLDPLAALEADPYCAPVIREAKRRRLRIRPIPEAGPGYFQLSYGKRTERFFQAQFDGIGGVTLRLLYNKASSLALIAEAGLPVAEFELCETLPEALRALRRFREVVVKPTHGSGGKQVQIGLTTPEQVQRAWKEIVDDQRTPMVQEHLPGHDHRVLVVGREVTFCVQRQPAFVTGDGQSTIAALVNAWNKNVPVPNRVIRDTPTLRRCLKRQGYRLTTVLPERAEAVLGELANSHQGGFSVDFTEQACPEALEIAREVCRRFDCDFLGVDFLSEDFTVDPGKIIEVNPHAGLTLHHQPTFGSPRNVAAAILDHLFPESR